MELYERLTDFCMDSLELIRGLEESLLYLEGKSGRHATVNNMCCAIHTLQESANLFCMDHVVVLADAMEKVLIRVDRGEVLSDEPVIALLLSCCARIRMLIEQTSPDWITSPQWKSKVTEDELLNQLNGISLKSSWNESGNYFIETTLVTFVGTPVSPQ